jgi:hypothetical protein
MHQSNRSWLRLVMCAVTVFYTGMAIAQRNLVVGAAAGSPRYALVIGNDNYARVSKLDNARADARAIARALEQSGFNVTLKLDVGRSELLETVRNFKARLSGGSEAVFYFAGHGVQLGAANYLLPVDIVASNEEQVKDDGLPLQRVLDDFTEQKTRFSLAIVDACRDNPFPRVAGRSIGSTRGLAPTTAASGQMVIYSAGAGQTALDRLNEADRDPNGLFTRLFLREMLQPVSVDRVLRNVRDQVVAIARSVGHEQVPALYDQAIGEFYFRAPTGGAQKANVPPSPSPAVAAPDPRAEDRALWETVKDSSDAGELQAYLDQYPRGIYAGVARARIKTMTTAKPPVQLATTAPTTAPATSSASRPSVPPAAASTPGAAPLDISGTWREIYPNPGNLTQTTQQGNTFRSLGRGMVLGKPIQVSASGTIRGRTLESTYQSTASSFGRCTGLVSADGTQVTSTCVDSVFGQFETSAVRQ